MRTRPPVAALVLLAVTMASRLGYDNSRNDMPGNFDGGNPEQKLCRECGAVLKRKKNDKLKCNNCGNIYPAPPKTR